MIPIRDTTPCRHFPVVNTAIIVVNVLVFFVQLAQGPNVNAFLYRYGLVPARYSVPEIAAWFSWAQQAGALVSFMFLHGGFLHLIGNMWMLYIFGDNIEDRLGPLRYLAFYMLCGMASGLFHLLLHTRANVPVIGASGAIAGVMGAYFILYPNAKILTLVPVFFFPFFFELPAFVFLGLWFALQVLSAAFSQGASSDIAWWAHIGGFAVGVILLKVFDRMPSTGITNRVRLATARKGSERLQVIRPIGPMSDGNLHGILSITPHEARTGARKLINLRYGFRSKMLRLTVPPRIAQGTLLRLRSLKKSSPDDPGGDVMLKVVIDER